MSENINLQNEEENVIVATFNIATENTTITLKNLTDMTQIDWGDGTINNHLSHNYAAIGEYTCKIYGVTTIGEYAFSRCDSLTSVVIPDSVRSIGYEAFYYCSSLTSVVIGDSVTSIGGDAFRDCSSLTSVVIGDSVTSIGSWGFAYCSSLTSVAIGDSVTSIGAQAFYGCSRLTSMVIGDGVTSIGGSAFYFCSRLASVTFKSKEALPVGRLTDSYINNSTPTYYVPTDSIEAYRNAWSGTVAEEKIQPDPDERLINLEGLRTYHDTLKEKYLDFMATQDYVKEQLVGKTDYLGVVDTIPNFPNAGAGDYCRVQTEFLYDEANGEMAHIGEVLIAVKDNPTQSKDDWDLIHNEYDWTHTHNYTPAGTVSKPTFTGSEVNTKVAEGTISVVTSIKTAISSQPTFTGSSVTTAVPNGEGRRASDNTKGITTVMAGASAALDATPTFTGSQVTTQGNNNTETETVINSVTFPTVSVTNGVLKFGAGSTSTATVARNGHTHTVTAAGTVSKPGVTVTPTTITVASNHHTHSVTAAGTVSTPTITVTPNTSNVASSTHTHTVVAEGSVSQPTFTGTQGTTNNPN